MQHFYPSLMADSWLAIIEGASHGDFQNAGFLRNKLFDALCKSGRISNQVRNVAPVAASLHWSTYLFGQQAALAMDLAQLGSFLPAGYNRAHNAGHAGMAGAAPKRRSAEEQPA